ncbi:MAG: cupin domain-containing protein [Candidatus Bathyarchaeia archaeon]
MEIRRLSKEEGEPLSEEGYERVNSLMIMPERKDISGFSCRVFRIEPGGHTPIHSHEREHLALVVKGVCRVEYGSEDREVGEGSLIYMKSRMGHRFSNPGNETLILFIMNLHLR